MAEFSIPTHDEQVLEALGRVEHLLRRIIRISQTQGAEMADTLDDVRSNLQDLNVDVDTAINEIRNTRTALDEALANAGVDQAARDEINGLVDSMQARIAGALNPAVPIPPPEEIPPAELPPVEEAPPEG